MHHSDDYYLPSLRCTLRNSVIPCESFERRAVPNRSDHADFLGTRLNFESSVINLV